MIQVGHLIKGLGRGGAETLLPHLVVASRATQRSHVAYFLPWKNALVDELQRAGASVTCLRTNSSFGMLLRVPAVRRWIAEHELDIVHCHLPMAGVVGRLAARAHAVPLIYTEHNLQPRYAAATRWANRLTWSLQDRAVAVSEEVAGSVRRYVPADVPLQVIRNGIPDLPPVSDDARSELRAARGLSEGPVVGTIAVFRRQKRLDLWVRVAQRVAARVPAARFVIVGDGPLRADLQAWVEAAGLVDRVVLPGLQTDVAGWLSCMDLFLMTSEFEGLPLALLEAMMSATPVAATAVGGIPEVVTDGVDGCLAPFGTLDLQVDQVVRLLGDAVLRDRLGAAGRGTARERFGIQRMATELERAYAEVIGSRGS